MPETRPGDPQPGPRPRIPVPLAVWPAPPDHADPTARLVARIVATFSAAGDLVRYPLAAERDVRRVADYLGRRYERAMPERDATTQPAGLVLHIGSPPADPGHTLAKFSSLAHQVRPGGVLVTVHQRQECTVPGAADPLAATIAAICATGLAYTAHIAALTAPLVGVQHALASTDDSCGGAPLPLARVHADVLVFHRAQVSCA